MNRRLAAILGIVILSLLALSSTALAQDANLTEDDSFTLKVGESVTVGTDESVGTTVVIGGDALISGTVEETLVVVGGDATISGEVWEDVVVIDGTLTLEDTATVNDVTLFSSDLVQSDQATVTGELNEDFVDFTFGFGLAVFFALWWVGIAIVSIAAGILFAWLGKDQLFGAVETVAVAFVPSLVTALLLWIVLPLVAVILLFTILGTPLALLTLFMVLPLLLLLGTCVIGAWIGSYIMSPDTTGRAIGGTTIGIIILLLLSLVPFVVAIVVLASMLGSGGLVYRAIKRSGDPDTTDALPSSESVAI